jgi:hypothetical protein
MNSSSWTWVLVAAGTAIACLALADPIWAELYYTAGVLLFAFGIIRAIYSRGQHRAFWIGFDVLFGIYSSQSTWSFFRNIGSQSAPIKMITSTMLEYVYKGMHPTMLWNSQPPLPMALPANFLPGYFAFLVMGHVLIAAGLGFVGGRVAQRLALGTAPPKYRSIEEILHEVEAQ